MTDLSLREQVMISHFISATGTSSDQAKQILQATQWQFEAALSLFLQEQTMPQAQTTTISPHTRSKLNSVIAPANTPATPPNFPDTLLSFSRLTASDRK